DRALTRAGVAHSSTYEHGIHDWPYWLDDLRQFLPMLAQSFAAPVAAPPVVPFDFRSAAAQFSVWGWSFRASHADEAAFVSLRDVAADGLVAAGRGRLRVDTATLYVPGRTYRVAGHRQVADR